MTVRRQSLLVALVALPSLLLAGCSSSSSDNNNPAPAAPSLVSIAITPSPVNVTVGGATQQLTVTGTYSDASTANLTSGSTFVSSAPAVATVGASTGIVTPVTGGTATVTATHTASGKTATVTVNVAKTLVSIAITPSPVNLTVGGATQQLTVTGTYNDASTANLTTGSTFVSSATGVATVGASTGIVTPVAAGTATVTATHTASGKTANVTVNVAAGGPTLNSIAITPNPVNLAASATQQLTVTGTYSDTSTANVTAGSTFVSSATGVATVGAATGLVTAVAAGSATITATHTASGKTATVAVNVVTTNGGLVFVDGYDPGVSFVDFGGATNAVTIDAATTLPNGHKSVKFVVPSSNYTGGAFVAALPRNLSAFNALTFWAKASTANALNVTGIGNDAAGNEGYSAESLSVPLTGTWTKYIIPIPAPSKLTSTTGLFHLAESNKNYTLWVGDIQYESLAPGVVDAPTAATVTWPGTQSVGIGNTYLIPYQPNTVSFTNPPLPNAGKLTNVGFRYYDLTSSAPAVATVSAIGLVTGVSGGTANITAKLGAINIAGQLAINVTAPLAVPTNNAPTPGVAPANVISLFSTAYTNHGVDTWRTGWSTCCNELVDPYAITGGHAVKQYTLHHFVGVEFGLAVPANAVDASTMTTFHMDIWSPNPPAKFEIQLVNDVNSTIPAKIIAVYDATGIATAGWVSLEIPLSSFAPALTNKSLLNQMLFLALDAGGAPSSSVVYVDNVYFHK